MSNEPNVQVRVHGRDYAAQVANDQVHKVLSEAMAQAAQNLIEEAVEQALDLAWKAHAPGDAFREWFEPVRAEAAKDLKLNPTVALFLARYLAA